MMVFSGTRQMTIRLGVRDQLSQRNYKRLAGGSNQRAPGYKFDALPIELTRHSDSTQVMTLVKSRLFSSSKFYY